MEQFLFPTFPPIWSGLDVQALSVLQGSSSRRMLFSAFDAVVVTLRVALDAIFRDVFEIVVLQFLMVSRYDLYRLSISCLTIGWWSFLAFDALLSNFMLFVFSLSFGCNPSSCDRV
ncbi:hypothetical protein ARALYDRAFT_916359 [Arabidopsis lyrata subsp. lyrata]|uniref:Uncharacterized protein n=1 Tax=Arabidopsis lyrata subsp. lyrata TaxID=81972 RepID=D7MJL9_ARALL|nr:hypothetical protein ARALYDRAFT_916359 [Arabidopsis lyrata subsp. lyrata]